METRFPNLYKANFDSVHYNLLPDVMRTINLQSHFYDPDGPLDPIPVRLRIQWSEEDAAPIDFEDDISAIQGTGVTDEFPDADGSDDEYSDDEDSNVDEVALEKKTAQAEWKSKGGQKSKSGQKSKGVRIQWRCPRTGCPKA